jgi:hypothetical protein
MRSDTIARYVRTMTKMITFVLRAQLRLLTDFELPLSPLVSNKTSELLLKLSDGDNACTAIHQLVMAILSDVRGLDSGTKCPGYYFIVFANVLPSGKIRDVEDIRGTLSEIKWPLRASTFWEMIQRFKELAPGEDPTR